MLEITPLFFCIRFLKQNLMKKTIKLLSCILCFTTATVAQQNDETTNTLEQLEQQVESHEMVIKQLKQFKVSGYVQTQFQYGEKNASLKVGGANSNTKESFSRIGVRRGRIKFTYEKGIAAGVFQLDITEKGIGLKDAYVSIKDPWAGSNIFKAGVFDRPFGYEVAYSSSRRESPERATVTTTLFPEERDLGAMLTLQASKNSPWRILKLEAAIIGGNGIKTDIDNRKDFIGHLSFNKNFKEKTTLSGGVSYYLGGVYQGSSTVYTMNGNSFESKKDTSNYGAFAKREYFGVDFQFATSSILGMTNIYSEYLFGTQPGDKNSSKSPNYSVLPTSHTYIRKFNGYYVTFVQDIGNLPFSVIVKYDHYDPNTKIAKNDIGLNGTGKADIAYSTVGAGVMWRINNSLRLTAYYDNIKNETSSNLAGYNNDLADNVFTLRLQYKY